MSIDIREVDISTHQYELGRELFLVLAFLVTFLLFLLKTGTPGSKEFEKIFPADTLPLVYIADTCCLLFTAGQIHLTIALLVFESKYARLSSCPDTFVKRWSRIKGTIVVTTFGLFASAFARLVFNKRKGHSQVLSRLNWNALFGAGLIFLSTHPKRRVREVAVCIWLIIVLFGSNTAASDADLVTFSMHLGSCGMLYNMISGGNTLYLWTDRFIYILYQLLAVTSLAVIAADLQY